MKTSTGRALGIAILAVATLPHALLGQVKDGVLERTNVMSESANLQASPEAKAGGHNSSDEIDQLKAQLAEQTRQIEQLRSAVEAQQRLLDRLATPNAGERGEVPVDKPVKTVEQQAPVITAVAWHSSSNTGILQQQEESSPVQPSPLSFKIGETYFTPVGFMDFTYVGRNRNVGSGIGTNFAAIPLNTSAQGQLAESNFSSQNSRLGLRFDANVHRAAVLGYYESDFLGNAPANVLVSTNSFTYRLRLFFADVRKYKVELLGGQSWSLITPGRKGISPLPENLFFTQDIDTNYQIGLPWARIPTFRFVYHPTNTVAWAIAVENPQQYIGGSAGGGQISLPANLAGANSPFNNQVNNGNTTFSVPNRYPDVISKIAWDPFGSHERHFELAAMLRSFRTSLNSQTFTAFGGGLSFNSNLELISNGKLRVIENFFAGRGVGRYLFGQGPDFIVNPNGTLGVIPAGGAVGGLESQLSDKLMIYGYYGGADFEKKVAIDTNGALIGYGFPGSSASNNRTIQEGTIGFQRTFWTDDRWGKLQFFVQYSYLVRRPWFIQPRQEWNTHMVFLNLRYALPGKAPYLKQY